MTYKDVIHELSKFANPNRANHSMSFFKTMKGSYGFGDKFIGATVPEQRSIARKFRDLSLSELAKLINSPIHEYRLTALIILTYKVNKDRSNLKELFDFYIENVRFVNNWDLVDVSARIIVGDYLLAKDRKILYDFAESNDLWLKRIAIISTHAFIAKNDYDDTLAISKILLNDDHDLIHKATGWMLREMGKKDIKTLKQFLDDNAHVMPRTMLRYAIEKLPDKERKHYMSLKNII